MRISAHILDACLCQPINNVQISIVNKSDAKNHCINSDEEGYFYFDSNENFEHIIVSKKGYVQKKIMKSEIPEVIRLLEDRIIGYIDHFHIESGDNNKAYISSTEQFSATIFRIGLDKEKCVFLGIFDPINQDIPNSFFVEAGLNWTKGIDWSLPPSSPSGLYILELKSSQSEFQIPFTYKANTEKEANLVVLANTNTWIAYNIWGGRSKYRDFESTVNNFSKHISILDRFRSIVTLFLPESIKKSLRSLVLGHKSRYSFIHKELSKCRPLANCLVTSSSPEQKFCDHLLESEWRLLAWLEREGHSYEIVPDYYLETNPDFFTNYKAIILSSHSEYWTCQMFFHLQKLHKKGAWILNLSGNSIYGEVKRHVNGSINFVQLFQNSTLDESQLLGVRTSMEDFGTAASFKVIDSGHWVFNSTRELLRKNSYCFGENTLNDSSIVFSEHRYNPNRPVTTHGNYLKGSGASGWETDKRTKTTPASFVILAKGENRFGGAEMLLKEPEGGNGGVFSSSSITFVGALLIDTVSSRIMNQVIEKVKT